MAGKRYADLRPYFARCESAFCVRLDGNRPWDHDFTISISFSFASSSRRPSSLRSRPKASAGGLRRRSRSRRSAARCGSGVDFTIGAVETRRGSRAGSALHGAGHHQRADARSSEIGLARRRAGQQGAAEQTVAARRPQGDARLPGPGAKQNAESAVGAWPSKVTTNFWLVLPRSGDDEMRLRPACAAGTWPCRHPRVFFVLPETTLRRRRSTRKSAVYAHESEPCHMLSYEWTSQRSSAGIQRSHGWVKTPAIRLNDARQCKFRPAGTNP